MMAVTSADKGRLGEGRHGDASVEPEPSPAPSLQESPTPSEESTDVGRDDFAPGPPLPTYEGDFVYNGHLLLDCGRTLASPTLHYAVYGRLNEERNNAVLACHALSGSALVGTWWPELFGLGKTDAASRSLNGRRPAIVDLQYDYVLCINMLGSCYGSTGPGSVNPETGEVYAANFPIVSIRDNVRAQAALLDSLEIEQLKLAIGGSIGGMQVLEWCILYPERVAKAVVIGVAPLGSMGLALNHLQRQAIQRDADWMEGNYLPHRQPRKGLSLARQIAMLSYKSPQLFEERFGRRPNRNGEEPWALDEEGGGLVGGRFDVAGFLDYQGDRFLERFDANTYLAILRTMDLWEPSYGYPSAADAYQRIQAELTFVGISSDWLFPAESVRRLANEVQSCGVRAEYREMHTDHGHDAFLAEQTELLRLLHLGT